MTDAKARALIVILSVLLLALVILIVWLRFFSGEYVSPEVYRATYGAEQFAIQLTAMAAGR
jgi:uncharacterized membrane protein (DUF485 family)